MMMQELALEFDIRLTGLRSAAHLNGRKGVITRQEGCEHWQARLDDSQLVCVLALNFVHVRPEEYKQVHFAVMVLSNMCFLAHCQHTFRCQECSSEVSVPSKWCIRVDT